MNDFSIIKQFTFKGLSSLKIIHMYVCLIMSQSDRVLMSKQLMVYRRMTMIITMLVMMMMLTMIVMVMVMVTMKVMLTMMVMVMMTMMVMVMMVMGRSQSERVMMAKRFGGGVR